ncbi:hypothetical protein EVJ58_g10238 [Rhodofomes roseus]|uniref:Uncharacterized protein n=1 Tax=Rhodofomes roseus TaxID=34475 RepID=A0A4Y9XS68_9APHY|nr:hypothetical protein EVJ58_g10238 [Rhodofomes roseus]
MLEVYGNGHHGRRLNSCNDSNATLDLVTELDMADRTGTQSVTFSARDSAEAYNRPRIIFTTPHIPDFFKLTNNNTSLTDYVMQLEAFLIGGFDLMLGNYSKRTLNLKKECVGLIRDQLCTATGGRCNKMNYVNFDTITAEFGVVLQGWPLKTWCSPSDISLQLEVQLLLNYLQSGTTHFRKLTTDKLKEWKMVRAMGAVAAMMQPGPSAKPIMESAQDVGDVSSTATPEPVPTDNRDGDDGDDSVTHKRKRADTFINITAAVVNGANTIDGSQLTVAKKQRKVQKDKGQKRGPRKSSSKAARDPTTTMTNGSSTPATATTSTAPSTAAMATPPAAPTTTPAASTSAIA